MLYSLLHVLCIIFLNRMMGSDWVLQLIVNNLYKKPIEVRSLH